MALTRPAANDNLTGAGDPERLLGRGRPRGLFSTLRAEPLLASMGSRHRADARGRAESCCRRHAQSVGCGDLLVLYGSTGRGGAGGVSLTERSGSYAAGGIEWPPQGARKPARGRSARNPKRALLKILLATSVFFKET